MKRATHESLASIVPRAPDAGETVENSKEKAEKAGDSGGSGDASNQNGACAARENVHGAPQIVAGCKRVAGGVDACCE